MRRLVFCLCLASLAAGQSSAQDLVCAGTEPANSPAASIAGKTVSPRTSAMQRHQGQIQALVLFARFAEEAPTRRTPPEYASRLFDAAQVGSLTHFYHTMSWGQFELRGDVAPRRYASARPAAAYVAAAAGKLGGFGEFVREVLEHADAEVDFTRYDNDGPDGAPNSGDDDGVVDYLFVMVMSTPRGFIIGGATGIAMLGLNTPFVSGDRGIRGQPIQVLGEGDHGSIGQEGTFSQTVGTMAHEFAHGLGLPDLYDLSYSDPGDDSAGVGRWCLMGWGAHGWKGDDGPNPFSAWCLKELGWLGPDNERLVEVGGDTTRLEVAALQQGGQVVEVPLPLTAVDAYNTAQEYLLLEQRTRSGSYYDRHLPGEGLLVWHIRPQQGANGDERAKEVDLLCADGLYQDAGYPLGRRADGKGGLDNLDFWAHDEAYTAAHQGNMGDATDPFDGSRFTRLEKLGNPSIDPYGALPDQARGPGLRLRRQGERMWVDVERLRWAGIIHQEVHWAGEVLVDGDVQVAPEGRLVIHPGTQVRFAGSDRLHTGRDPGHSELDIQGEMIIKAAASSRSGKVVNKVSFEALNPGQSWYGIVINPAYLSRIEVPDSSYEMHGDQYGVLLPGAPPEARGQVVKQVQIIDTPGLETAGNGDGRLQPGETFRCVVELDNWSLVSYEEVGAELSWSSRLITLPDKPLERSVRSTPSGFFPGTQLPIELPPLALSPAAAPGDSLGFTLKLSYKRKANWQTDRIPFTVQGRYPEHQVQFAVPGQPLRGASARVTVDQTARVEAQIQGDITGAELVLRSVPDLTPLAQIPMTRKGNRLGRRIFEGQVQLPEPGLYQARLRLQGASGAVVFSPAILHLWATAEQDSLPILALVGEGYQTGQRGILRQALEQLAAEQGRQLYMVDSAPAQGALYQALLPHYAGTRGVVLWLGKSMNRETQELFGDFLEEGGRLGLISNTLNLSSANSSTSLAALVHVQDLIRTSPGEIRSLYAEEGVHFNQAHSAMKLLAPAEPVLLDDRQQIAGMRLEVGGYRLVYLPFDMDTRNKQVIRHLFESTLAFLRGAIVQAAMEAPGREVVDELSLLPAGQRVLVRATAGREVAQARLMVRAFPGMDSILEVPMSRQAGQFAAYFAVPAGLGHYQLSLRLRDAQGKSLFNTAGLQALGLAPEQPFVLVLAGQRSTRDRASLKEMFTRQAENLGLQTAVLDQDLIAGDELYQTLLQRYLAKGELVVWLGERMDTSVQAAFRAFLAQGGKLLLGSAELGSSADIKEFMQEQVHVVAAQTTNQRSMIRSVDALEGEKMEVMAVHGVLDLMPPALPVLRDAGGKVAGLRLDTGGYRLVYLPFELAQLKAAQAEALAAPLLSFLHRGEAGAAVLEADGVGSAAGLMLVAPERPLALRVRAPSGATAASVIAFKVPGMDSVAQVPLRLAQGIFSGELSLPVAGQYLLATRLSRGGQTFFSGRSLQLAPYLFAAEHQVLAFVDERYTAVERRTLKTDLEEGVRSLGLQVDFVDQALLESALYETLLERYLEPGKLVVWLGRELGVEGQEVFRRFAERGGRLLVASAFLHQRSDPAFLRQIFHIQGFKASQKGTFAGAGEDFSIRYYSLTIEAPAAPALVSRTGEVAALQLDAGIYRAVYFAFDLRNVEPLARRRELLATAFAFLGTRPNAQLPVLIKQVVAPGPVVVLGPLVPQVVVFNAGSQVTTRFRVGYQILRGAQVLISADREEAPLAGGSERTLSLTPWMPGAAVDLSIRFGVKSAAGEWVYLPPQPLRLVESLSPFAEVALPGEQTAGNGAGFFDCDNDGDLDLYLVRRGRANQLFRNDGKGFAEQAREAGLADQGLGRGLALGDYDADGDVDLFLVNEEDDHLFRNEGAGRFAEVTDQAAADLSSSLAGEGSGRSAGFFDGDNDGDLDLYLVNSSAPNRFFVNEGGRFAERAAALGLADEGTGKGLALADWDGDGDVDLLVTIQSGGTQFYRNEGGRFQPLNEALGLVFAEGEIGPVFGDYDNDGDLDLFVSNEWRANQLWRNEEGLAFTLLADSLGQKSTGAGWGDFDNDGDLDLLTTSVNSEAGGDQLYQNRGQGSLVPVGALVNLSPATSGRGLSFADYDGDGDLDAFVADADSSRLYRNQGNAAHWLEVELAGPSPNRQGLGARVEVVAGGRRQQRQVFAAFGYASQGPARLHLGLGRAAQVDTLKVRWPDGAQSVLIRLAADQLMAVRHPGLALAGKAAGGAGFQTGLGPGYPNPFNASTLIRFQTALAGKVQLEIYDLLGQRVRLLADGEFPLGSHQRLWDGRDQRGRPVASGVYFCRLHTGGQFFSQRLLLLK